RMLEAVTGVQVQLVYFGGKSCKASPWVGNPKTLTRLMESVRCVSGITQLQRVFDHLFREHNKHPVAAMMFVGDSFEEDHHQVVSSAQYIGVPCFMFQEGDFEEAERTF